MASEKEDQVYYLTVFFRVSSMISEDFVTEKVSVLINSLTQVAKDTQARVLSHEPLVVEFKLSSSQPLDILKTNEEVRKLESQESASCVWQTALLRETPKKLAVFDMDSTLIQQEVIDLLAAKANSSSDVDVGAAVAAITARAMNGELDFADSLRERVNLLKGLPTTVFEELRPALTLTPGADILVKCLKKSGAKVALLSGGFMPLATYIGGQLGIDYIHANELADEHDHLTGKLNPEAIIVDSAKKREMLIKYRTDLGLKKEEVMAVGDGANDLPMMWEAGLGVAVHAKPKVQEQAPCKMNTHSLADILYLYGLNEREIAKLSE